MVIRPSIAQLEGLDFTTRLSAVPEGEKAVARVLPALKDKLAHFGEP